MKDNRTESDHFDCFIIEAMKFRSFYHMGLTDNFMDI